MLRYLSCVSTAGLDLLRVPRSQRLQPSREINRCFCLKTHAMDHAGVNQKEGKKEKRTLTCCWCLARQFE